MASAAERQPQPLPMITWGYALIFALLLSWRLLDHLMQDTPPSQSYYSFNASRLAELKAAVDRGATGIVMLGDSRLRYGTWHDDQLAAALAERLGRPVHIVRLVQDWGVFGDFSSLAPLVLAARPALVVLQDELFAKERETQGRLLLGRSYLLWQLVGRGLWNPDGRDPAIYQDEQRCEVLAAIDAATRKEKVFLWVSFDPAGANAKAAAAFVDSLDAASVRVAVLSIPITSDGSSVLPGFERPADARTLAAPPTIADSDFCDVVHMNEAGRNVFSRWLTDALAVRLTPEAS